MRVIVDCAGQFELNTVTSPDGTAIPVYSDDAYASAITLPVELTGSTLFLRPGNSTVDLTFSYGGVWQRTDRFALTSDIAVELNSADLGPAALIAGIASEMKAGYGELYVSTPATTVVSASSTYYKVAGTTTLSTTPPAVNWDMPANNRLRYTGTLPRVAVVRAVLSASIPSGTNVALRFALGKNGTVQTDSESRQFIVLSLQDESVAVQGTFVVVPDDYIEIFAQNDTNTTDIDVSAMRVGVTSLPH